MENSFVSPKLRAATELLTHAQTQLDAAIEADRAGQPSAGALDGISGDLKAVRLSLDEISRQIMADTEALPEMRDCPACGRSTRLDATRCGYCWKNL
jgi:hypothetical protein